jgi:hypothetical protein
MFVNEEEVVRLMTTEMETSHIGCFSNIHIFAFLHI